MGCYGIPFGQSIDDIIGMALGYQLFLDGIDSHLRKGQKERPTHRTDVNQKNKYPALLMGMRISQSTTRCSG
jgi:hypothetical protein